MKYNMFLKEKPFYAIKDGSKDIELGLNDDKRRKIKIGDTIEFTLNDSDEKVGVVVLDLYHYDSFENVYKEFDKVRLGYREDENSSYKDMEQYYSCDDIKEHGVVAIKIMLIERVTPAILTDYKICPTCFNKENNSVLYGSNEKTLFYEDNLIECFFVGNPRSEGHVAISSRKHYKDMMDIGDELCEYVFVFAKKLMNIIKKVYESESVYLCTMCDGPMNHFHLQLIPRYKTEKRGSTNFVKERKEYVFNKEKFDRVKELLNEH